MLLLAAFAFLAGLVTFVSPCVLPVLPVLLAGAAGGGRGRPWGVALGFTLTFALAAVFLAALARTLGFDPEVLRWGAAAVIALAGLVLVVPVLQEKFEAWASALTARVLKPRAPGKTGGFGGGLVLGAGLGLVWTPCVGPILASVLALSVTGGVDGGALVLAGAYSLGTALPLLGVMAGGRALAQRVAKWTGKGTLLTRTFGVLTLGTAVLLATGGDRAVSTWLLRTFPGYGSGLTAWEDNAAVRAALEERKAAEPKAGSPSPSSNTDPLALGSGPWIQSMPLTLEGLKGKVVLVDFWTYSCINCVRTLPYLAAWDQKYRALGLVIVGVHSPEFGFEGSEANVRRAVADLGVTWPVVMDNGFDIWQAFDNKYWPTHYLYDRDGQRIDTHAGEGAYAETEAKIRQALGLPAQGASAEAAVGSAGPLTPETYLGYGRGQRFASPEAVVEDQSQVYSAPDTLAADRWAFSGPWTIGREHSAAGAGAGLVLQYRGRQVFLVAAPGGPGPVHVRVKVDGREVGVRTLKGPGMLPLVDGPEAAGGRLELEFDGPVEVYSFTFG